MPFFWHWSRLERHFVTPKEDNSVRQKKFRHCKRNRIADDIITTMRTAGYDVREYDPFKQSDETVTMQREKSPQVSRMKILWHEMEIGYWTHTQNDGEIAVKEIKIKINTAYLSEENVDCLGSRCKTCERMGTTLRLFI